MSLIFLIFGMGLGVALGFLLSKGSVQEKLIQAEQLLEKKESDYLEIKLKYIVNKSELEILKDKFEKLETRINSKEAFLTGNSYQAKFYSI